MDFFCLLNKGLIKLIKILKISCIFLVFLSINFSNALETQAQDTSIVIAQLASQYQINPQLIYSMISVESSFNINAVSHCDARGIMQVTRPTWDWITQEYLEVNWDFDEDCFDLEKNITVGIRFLKWISDYLDNHSAELNDTKLNLMAACYNAGPGAIQKYNFQIPPYEETQNYVKKINDFLQ
ncbi:MAG: lytic transglycosylase domain-containing protein [Candidatus Omnitrophota bacterium]